MVQKYIAAIVALVISLAGPVSAQTTVIASLGQAPLLGPIASTQQMQREVREHFTLLKSAAARLGVSPQQYQDFRVAVATGDVHWVEIPRHLDAMSWSSGDGAHVIHDVVIPAHTHGWEIDVAGAGRTLALYMPAACGNLATLSKPRLQQVASSINVVPVPDPVPAAVAADAAPETVVAEAAPEPTIDLPPPAKAKRPGILGFFLSLLAAGVGISSGVGGGSNGGGDGFVVGGASADTPCP